MAKKQSSDRLSSLAARVLRKMSADGRYRPTRDEIRQLAGSVLSQDEKKGKRRR